MGQSKSPGYIGCGGDFLTEEIAKFGLETTGVDISSVTLQVARKHAEALNLSIDYHAGMGEKLPFADDQYEMVFCLDVLEHVKDFDAIISEVSRVLTPGGLFFFETVNRTLLSYLIVIFFMQEFPFTRVLPPRVHTGVIS
ncbi:MAG TPA: methyltransferase domain-containing protein [Clostridia bacterium]|nr:methyltransferase domain-containing protein [Clostridia bacterium]